MPAEVAVMPEHAQTPRKVRLRRTTHLIAMHNASLRCCFAAGGFAVQQWHSAGDGES